LQDALLQSGLTADTFTLLAMLNMSVIKSMLKRSPKLMRLATRKSLKTVQGVTPALRPRFPSSASRVGVAPVAMKPIMHGSCRTPVGEYFDLYVGPQAGLIVVFGRPVSEESWRLSPLPVMMLNGRPEETSSSGATVQLLKNLLTKPLPPSFPV